MGVVGVTAVVSLPTEPALVRAATIIALVLSTAAAGAVVVLRVRIICVERRRPRIAATWEPAFSRSLVGEPVIVPRLRRRDRAEVLSMWNRWQDSLSGPAVDRLNTVALIATLDLEAMSILQHGPLPHRVVAIETLGHLRSRNAWPRLASIVAAGDGPLWDGAAKAMVRIDAEQALATLVPLVARMPRLHPARCEDVFADAPADQLAASVGRALHDADPPSRARLVRLLDATRTPQGLALARQLLAVENDPDVVAACLHLTGSMRDPADAPTARRLLVHPAWFVRLQAAIALGRIGSPGDESRLSGLLSDPEPWVRHRAAGAVVSARFVSASNIEELRDRHPDPLARSALTEALTVRRLA